MANPLKEWRRDRRDAGFWKRARGRSAAMREGEIISQVDTSLMLCGQAISRYRHADGREGQLDQLFELRMNLEACLGMLDNVLPD
jgi:hypothetical protein